MYEVPDGNGATLRAETFQGSGERVVWDNGSGAHWVIGFVFGWRLGETMGERSRKVSFQMRNRATSGGAILAIIICHSLLLGMTSGYCGLAVRQRRVLRAWLENGTLSIALQRMRTASARTISCGRGLVTESRGRNSHSTTPTWRLGTFVETGRGTLR